MRLIIKVLIFSSTLVATLLLAGQPPKFLHSILPGTAAATAATAPSGFSNDELRQFTALEPIDTHTHIYKNDPAFVGMLKKLHLHILDIEVAVDNGDTERLSLAQETKDAWAVVHASEGHAALCATFDPYTFNQPGFAKAAILEINQQFRQGAIAIKLWKNIGMEIKDTSGNYILPNNPALEPIYEDIALHHKTLIMHIADPDVAWEPPNPAAPNYQYFKQHPEWYMYKIPHSPSKEQILLARDHVLEANPHLRVVGAHIGSMESNFDQVAQHLDRYPNFAVDLAARLDYLMRRPRTEMIAFITKYQDRLIYGTDDGLYPEADVQRSVTRLEESYARDWRYLATNDSFDYRGIKVQGLALPQPILRKLYHDNAVRWFPGILAGSR